MGPQDGPGKRGEPGIFWKPSTRGVSFLGDFLKKPRFPPEPRSGLEPKATDKIRTDVFQLCSAIHTDVVTVLTQYPSEFNEAFVGGR